MNIRVVGGGPAHNKMYAQQPGWGALKVFSIFGNDGYAGQPASTNSAAGAYINVVRNTFLKDCIN